MIRTYSSYEKALEAVPGFCKQMEQDVFIYLVSFPCGQEWSLRTRDEIFSEDTPGIVYKYYLPVDYKFENRDNVYRELEVWKARLKCNIDVERHYRHRNGYKILSHYTLQPCST